MRDSETSSVDRPRLFNIFTLPETKSVRAVSTLRQEISLEDVWGRVEGTKKIRTSGKSVVKFRVGKGQYLLLFPSNRIQIYAPSEERVREVLKAFRDELYEAGLLR